MASRNRSWRARCALAACVVGVLSTVSSAGVVFLSGSTARWTFDPDSAGGTESKVVDVNPPPPSGSMPAPPSYQLLKTFTAGSSNSTGKGSIGYVTNSTTATFTLASGTGVNQVDPDATYRGDSVVRVGFGGLYQATSPSFGPIATGYVSIAVGGTVGTRGSARFIGNVQFRNEANTADLRTPVGFDQTWTTAGPFSKVFTSSAPLNPQTIPTGTKFRVNGFFEFRSSNHESPSSIAPVDIDIGVAPPTATWYVNKSGSWNGSENWTPPPGSVIDNPATDSVEQKPTSAQSATNPAVVTIPNGAGQRARFATFVNNKKITLDSDITLGAIDVNSTASLGFKGKNKFVLDTSGDSASIHTHDVNGTNKTTFDTAIQLNKNLELITDATYIPGMGAGSPRSSAAFNKPINGDQMITKDGDGDATFNAKNTYTGGTRVKSGKLYANAAGSLGEGAVDVEAYLGYNAAHAARKGQQVTLKNGAQLDLGIAPGKDESFYVQGLSVISGSSRALRGLRVEIDRGKGDGSKPQSIAIATNAILSTHAMIGHKNWDTSPRGTAQGLGNTPLFIFGISSDFAIAPLKSGLTFGSESKSPWIGFGSDRLERTFGNNPNAKREVLKVAGAAKLVSLHETLWLNARIESADSNASLEKIGAGVVSIENTGNGYSGSINVSQGMLQVNGNLPAVQNVSVNNSALGGHGYIGGAVSMGNSSSLNPGSTKPAERVGTLRVKSLQLSESTEVNVDLGRAGFANSGNGDLVQVEGDLLLDGILNITDTGDFTAGTYILFQHLGALNDKGLQVGSVPNRDFTYSIEFWGNQVVLKVSADKSPTSTATAP